MSRKQRDTIEILVRLIEAIIVACVASTIATTLTLHFS